jgi:hypothetical protein
MGVGVEDGKDAGQLRVVNGDNPGGPAELGAHQVIHDHDKDGEGDLPETISGSKS